MALSGDRQITSSGTPSAQDCVFCEEFSSGRFRYNIPVLETGLFFVLADIAPIALGHLIILPKRHVSSLSELEASTLEELRDLVAELHTLAANVFEWIALAEHGSGIGSVLRTGCVDHAHLHMCPVECTPTQGVQLVDARAYAEHQKCAGFPNLTSFRGEEYLLWGTTPTDLSVWTPGRHRCSQLLRGVLNSLNDRDPSMRWQGAISRAKALEAAKLFRQLLHAA
jgi:diadenosine tetraphosphate (Ap4A) HIT family hydrolase